MVATPFQPNRFSLYLGRSARGRASWLCPFTLCAALAVGLAVITATPAKPLRSPAPTRLTAAAASGSAASASPASTSAVSARPASARPASVSPAPADPIGKILNYPFSTPNDMAVVADMCAQLLNKQQSGRPRLGEAAGSSDDRLRAFLNVTTAFTSTATVDGEQLSIVKFADSNDKAIRRLRDEIHLPPPPGGAILRVYSIKRAMPPPIDALFGEHTQGITEYCRFIAVIAEGTGEQELKDTISHELAHAYICSILGARMDSLPSWFHEGAALYLSDGKDRYVSQTASGIDRIAWSTKEYEEYHLVFRYLSAALGPEGVAEFIRKCVQEQSVTGALKSAGGLASYEDLRARAFQWQREQDQEYESNVATAVLYGVTAFVVLFVIPLLVIRTRAWLKRRADDERMALNAVASAVVLAAQGDLLGADERLERARAAAPWSASVRTSIEEARRNKIPM